MYDNIENISCDVLCGLVPFVRFKKSENTHGRVLLLVKLQVSACNFTKSNTPPWLFFTFLKLYIRYQITRVTKVALLRLFLLISFKIISKFNVLAFCPVLVCTQLKLIFSRISASMLLQNCFYYRKYMLHLQLLFENVV